MTASSAPILKETAEVCPMGSLGGGNIPDGIMTVAVCDPWTTDTNRLWMHEIYVDVKRVAGLITGTPLPPLTFHDKMLVQLGAGPILPDLEPERVSAMERFTREAIGYRISGTPISRPLKLYVVPLSEDSEGGVVRPDMPAIDGLLAYPRGNPDWDSIDLDIDERQIMVTNVNLIGKTYLLHCIRHDLSPASTPPADSLEAEFSTYREYWIQKWTGKPGSRKRPPYIPEIGPLMEVISFPRLNRPSTSAERLLFPRDCCRWIDLSKEMCTVMSVLPALYRRATVLYRAVKLRAALGLPLIADALLGEALTLPCATAGYNNQRLETLGDAVLNLCTSVHLYNTEPNADEGQLTSMRQDRIANLYLLGRARDIGLETFLTCETTSVKNWVTDIQHDENDPARRVTRNLPRRSLQDCMEAILGASFATGGIQMALRAGESLGLDFGGLVPWNVRFKRESPIPSEFTGLEDALGYSFRCGRLLVEALTHRSSGATSSYERLEFLGDAILDLVVIDYLFDKFPEANSDQLAWPRTRVICAPVLAAVGVRRLGLHQLVVMNSDELSMAVERDASTLEACSAEEIVQRSWAFDPPKVLSDAFESVIGAVLVDSNYDYERTAAVVELLMEEVLQVLTPTIARDPITTLLEWAAGNGCRNVDRNILFKLSPTPLHC
ncbi:ribonuclease III domain-containing protein [Roridomyces roridus]|uniref:Ribonuclease III domain-containing protein n=1 Tax=Roridomyces roridus TaxID=1738132 RepID=A0AAD7FQB4_9AGAR|nr:ribonuclease III domain-containing protein [Roridomyces roridus]